MAEPAGSYLPEHYYHLVPRGSETCFLRLPDCPADKGGTLDDVLAPAGQQVYVIGKPDGKTFMVPCVPEFIKEVSFGESRDAGIYVKLIEGMEE